MTEGTMFIDADTHVDENPQTWSFMAPELAPKTVQLATDEIPTWLLEREASIHTRFWFFDGRIGTRRIRSDERTGTTAATRELDDVEGRVRDMDAYGVEVQVIYPTFALQERTKRPELEVALTASYNRWLADRCLISNGRLRWVALLPYHSIPDAIAEMERAKEHGAVGILKRGVECNRSASDPYFFPVYERAAALDLPICIHSSLPWSEADPHLLNERPVYSLGFTGVTVLQAFYALVRDNVPSRIEGLRFGFIEAGVSWIPHLFHTLGISDRRKFLQDSRFFVSCETGEDLRYIVDMVGDECLLIGTDYSHGDRASILRAHERIAQEPGLSTATVANITRDNALQFYGL